LEAFYFGTSSNQLLGAYHPPQGASRREGIVLCNPFGQEYMRAHRSFRRLAINLAVKGFSVLRFDYRGTGDSAGTLQGVTAKDWMEDIESAIQEIMDVAAVQKVSLLGLRVGALLAAEVAAKNKSVNKLVLWDPIVSGQAYVNEIVAEIAVKESRSRFVAQDGSLQFNGFSMPALFKESLSSLDLCSVQGLERLSVAEIVSHENSGFEKLQQAYTILPRFHYQLAPAPHDWNYVDHVGGILWPQTIVEAIENYFTSRDISKN
jgi:pimeloyl-ACP methyl ester carboxylesterase